MLKMAIGQGLAGDWIGQLECLEEPGQMLKIAFCHQLALDWLLAEESAWIVGLRQIVGVTRSDLS